MVMNRAKNKELTAKQYEFYKRKGMTDTKIMEIHDMHSQGMNNWKKQHNLVGVKFEPDVKVSAVKSVTSSPSVEGNDKDSENKQFEAPVKLFNDSDKQIPAEELKTHTEAHNDDLTQDIIRKLKAELKVANEQLANRQRYNEDYAKNCEQLRELNEENELIKKAGRDLKAQVERLTIENANLQYERKLQDEALEREARKDDVLTSVMEMYVNAKRNIDSTVEGEVKRRMEMKISETTVKISQWAIDRNLHTAEPMKQIVKLGEEFGELCSGLAKGKVDATEDAIGDMYVVLTILAMQTGTDIEHCAALAYNEIKDRKGKMINGVFVKESDLIGVDAQ